jgi:hypothetical protein
MLSIPALSTENAVVSAGSEWHLMKEAPSYLPGLHILTDSSGHNES